MSQRQVAIRGARGSCGRSVAMPDGREPPWRAVALIGRAGTRLLERAMDPIPTRTERGGSRPPFCNRVGEFAI